MRVLFLRVLASEWTIWTPTILTGIIAALLAGGYTVKMVLFWSAASISCTFGIIVAFAVWRTGRWIADRAYDELVRIDRGETIRIKSTLLRS